MNPHLQNILNLIQQDESLTAEQKNAIAQTLKDVDKELQIITFKLDRTEKVKRTTAILLEETIEELEQKRKDVEAQNKELEIESALERVETIAMSMNRLEDMVDVCRIISQQLELLNVKEIRNVQTAIFYEQKAVYMDYEYYAKHDKTFITEVDYTNHDVGKTFAHQMLKGPGEVYTHGFTGKEVLDWYEYQKTTNVFIDTYLETATSLNYYWFSLGPIALGISTYHPLNESEINLFKRFLKVFELSYRRYLDIEKAIAQAREAKIEAALEKVRSRSLAMHKSDELNEVVMVLFERLKDLQIPVTAVGIHVFSEGSKDLNVYVCGDIGNGLAINNYLLPYFNHPIADDLYDAHEKGLDFFVGNYSKKQKNSFYKHVFEHSALRDLPDDIKSMIFQSEFYSITMAPVKNSVITVNDFEGKPLSDAEADVVKRFAKVFEQAYIRFLDLQKAESQARESQIQLAMERVRARTMAMQRSEELADVATVLFQQVKSLGVSQWTCGFNIWEVGDKEYTFYPGSPDGDILPPCKVPLTEHPVFIQMDESRRRGDELYVYEKTGEIQADHYRYMHALPGIGDLLQSMLDAGLSFPTFQIDHLANFSHGNLVFITYEPVPEMHDVFKRFAKVFEQTYTRFLDLQKAEAQARESQVQLAMERVRARTMAMQHSSELADAATLLLTQVRDLGIKTFGAGFNIWQPDGLSVTSYMANPDGSIQPPFSLPHNENPYFIKISDARQRGEHFFVMESGGEELEEMRRYMLNLPGIKEIVGDTVTSGDQWPKFQVNHCAFFSQGYLLFITYEPVPEMWDIFKRFAKVFEQTYTRFLDLQKAEAQARESQIQLALERVRARTMAMQKSDELPEAANLLFQQVQSLGMPAWSAGYCIWSEDQPTGQAGKKSITAWMSSEGILQPPFKAPTTEDELFIQMRKGSEQGKTFHVVEMGGEKLVAHYQYMRTLPVVSEVLDSIIEAGHPLPTFQIMHQAYFTQGFLLFITYEPVPEAHDIFKRFAKVFEQTYTRFLDLQKAEAQAREAKIETALEKVRSRTMAMQRSDELGDVAEILFKQVKELGIHPWTTGFNIWQEGNDAYIDWITNPSGGFVEPYTVDLTTHPIFREISNAKKRGEEFQVFDLSGEPLAETYALLMGFAPKQFEGFLSSGFSFPTRQFNHYVYGAQVGLMFITPEPCPEAHDIFKRFGKVFEQTYTRFLDLQKAEAQTREAHIEAALERVRSRTMAMYQSNELAETAHVLFEQFRDLGENPERMAIGIVNEEEEVIEIWATQHGGTLMNSMYKFTIDEPHVMNKLYTAWKKQESVTLDLKGNELEEYFQFLKNAGALVDRKAFGDRRVQMAAFFSKGLLMTISPEPRPSGTLSLLERFAAVFNLTYTRFLDLQKAEAQTREAIIEASLEKVRGKAMAMHDSKDLSSTAIMVFTELQKLGIKPFRNGVGILSKDSRKGQLYSATSSNEIDSLALVGWVELSGHPILEKIYDSWYANEDYFPILEGEQLKTYYEHLSAGFSIPSAPNRQPEEKQYGHFIAFSIGSVYSWASKPYTEEEIKILKRFAAIIDLTFRRYLELQHSEANAKEAIKQSSLDRVRAEIASMRTVDDLSHITPIVWRELTTLGVPFFRCGIYIIKEDEQLVHMYLSTPEGKSLAVLHLPFTGAEITIQTVHHWRKQQIYSTHWDRDQFIAWVKTLQGQGQVQSVESYQGAQAPPESLTLQFIPFTQGMLYIGSADALNEDQFSLAKELANAFSVAYARYEDFKKLEEAKSKIETTLSDLKAAQSQLVQSEKMASLGELTAGIAHEIQNPLNFVNNFADINNELIKELVEATSSELRDAGNEADIIATIKENSEKINYHGKRAESIVRGMLQHSRKSAGIKEPTDINALADEYMRLSYHGLRAKDKSFNAEFKIDLDPSLPLINVIPQDVGRVFLNLFNNAFWACAERGRLEIGKRKMENASSDLPSPISDLPFSPLVTLTTKNLLDHIEIHISDNGPGIPSNIIDKIFQPFFTTKPTGQGTGLGLSLAYDIIKAHIGELKVETKVGQGSVFTILLPVT